MQEKIWKTKKKQKQANKLWLLLFFMAVAIYCYYEKVHRKMHLWIVLYLFNIYIYSKSKVTENIFNLQEWHQNTKTFISYKTFTVGKKLKPAKNDQTWSVVTWYRFFIRQPTFQWSQEWLSYTGLTVDR